MNKTTIKISVLAFLGFMTYGYAQQQDLYKGKVGVNTTEPSATMDIRPNDENAQVEAKTNEGIIAPKLSKTRIANIETPVEGTLVYATDETTSPISAYTGGDTKVAKITEKGYYFYNGTEWVKAGSDGMESEWVYDSITNRIKLKRSGQVTGFKSSIYYDNETGAFRDIESDTIEELDASGNVIDANVQELSKGTLHYTQRNTSGIIKNKINHKGGNYFVLYGDEKNVDNTLSLIGSSSVVVTGKKQQSPLTGMIGLWSSVDKMDSNNIVRMQGVGSEIKLVDGGVTGYATVMNTHNNINTASDVSYASSLRNHITIGSKATNITDIVGVHETVNYAGNLNGGKINNVTLFKGINWMTAASTQINVGKMIGLHYHGFAASEGRTSIGTVDEHYGIYLGNIDKATLNYSIYTNAGNIRFGDLKHSVSTNIAGAGDRPVFVTADGVLKIGNASTALSRAIWETDGNHVKLAVKADGSDRVDNIITINDAGQIFASSFKGTNGATIFPDYVFQKYYTGTSSIKADYNFKSLSQVEDFVKTNGHLPGYKSAETIKAQGYVDLMETQLTNVEKIEELYLHLMEKEKEVKELRNKNQELENRLERLEQLLK